jgi:DNA (cytosine-5)-methyltransferase 1
MLSRRSYPSGDLMLKVFSSFTGIGCPEIALRDSGIPHEVVGISEVDRYAILAYDAIHSDPTVEFDIPSDEVMLSEIEKRNIAYNFSTGVSEIPRNSKDLAKLWHAHVRSKNYGDIRTIDTEELPEFNLFSYSFPCKNISVAGEQAGLEEGSETQSSLLWECQRIIEAKRPEYLLMENVKNLVGQGHIEWIEKLDEMGYNSRWDVMNAKSYNCPQNRERVIMMSIRKDVDKGDFSLPMGYPSTMSVEDIAEEDVPEDFTIPHHRCKEVKEEYEPPEEEMNLSALLTGSSSRTTSLKQIGRVDHDKNPHATRRVYDATGLCPTLTSMNGGDREPKMLFYDGEVRVRKLTPLECWRAMGIGDQYYELAKGAGLPKSKLYERSGRGIAVPMLMEVFKRLQEVQLR